MKMKKVLSAILAGAMLLGAVPEIFAETVLYSDAGNTLNEGLIAYYNFDRDDTYPSSITDASGNGNNATVVNTVIKGEGFWNPGVNNVLQVSDGVAHFPGMTRSFWQTNMGAALKLPNNFNMGVSSFTYSAWINADSTYEYANAPTRFFDFGNIGSGGNDTYNSIFARYTPASGQTRIQDRAIASGSSDPSSMTETTLSEMPFTDAWGLFSFVYDYNKDTNIYESTVYVNGNKVTELSSSDIFKRGLDDLGELDDASNGLFIGRTVWGASNLYITDNPDFCGMMDEIRIYNRALTDEEIYYLYENTSPVGALKMTDYYVENVTTFSGDYPLLPEYVVVEYNTGALIQEAVTWENIPFDKYLDPGTFTVAGVTENGYNVEVNVIVIQKDASTLGEGLVLYYSFNNDQEEPLTITDDSGNGNNAAVDNLYTVVSSRGQQTVVESKLSIKDGVAYFPGAAVGSDFGLNNNSARNTYFNGPAIRLPNDANKGIEDFTYSAWVYADTDYRYAGSWQRLFDFGVSTIDTDSFFYRYTPLTGETRFQDRYISNDESSMISATLEDNPFKDMWGHLVITYKKSDMGEYYTPTVYINGEERYEYDNSLTTLVRSLGDLGNITDANNGLWIGRTQWNNSDNPDFKGKMDEIRLYNRALSTSEIKELYNTKKPSDMPVDYEQMAKKRIAVTEDVEVSTAYRDVNREGQTQMLISSNNGAANTRYGFMRCGSLTASDISSLLNCEKAFLSVYVTLIDNWGAADQFYCYGLTGDNTNWDVNTITMNNYAEQIGGSITNVGVSEVGELLDTQVASGQSRDFYMQWDITDFVKNHAAENFSFLLTCGSNVAYIYTSESGMSEKMPEIIVYKQGTPVTVNRVDKEGNVISSSVVYAVMGESYKYSVTEPLINYNNGIYVVDENSSSLEIDTVMGDDIIEVVYDKAESIDYDSISVRTYVGKQPTLQRVIEIRSEGYSAQFAVQWNKIEAEAIESANEFDVSGVIIGTDIEIAGHVEVYPEYNGGVGTDMTIYVYCDDELVQTNPINKSYGSLFTLSESYRTYLGNMCELEKVDGDLTDIGQSIILNKIGQHVSLYFTMKKSLEAELSVMIKADDLDATGYTMTAKASILNALDTDENICLAIADYNEAGSVTSVITEKKLVAAKTGNTEVILNKIPYDTANNTNMRVFLWNDAMEPLCDTVYVKDISVQPYLPYEVLDMMPTYDGAVSTLEKANSYWQNYQSYDNWYGGTHPAFWDKAAYHTGNMEMYKLTGKKDYLDYTINWANYNNWQGNDYTGDPSTWTWGYNQNQGNSAVLFGDWQICFQTYIDLYNLNKSGEVDIPEASVDRVLEVMGYQITKDTDAFWWWADALYMVMPVMTKLYKLTDDEAYLDALYKYFRYAKELMYDGEGGIPTSAEGYTTSASLNYGAHYSDPEDYKNLFFRDAGYVYPLNSNPGHDNEKNFWARGNGWVFAGLSKVLSDMPQSYEHYDEFFNTYMEMAAAIIACQSVDNNGYGFWTQSMLQGYPTSGSNPYGYETSGTAFFTYGLFWGINNGFLDKETYLEPALRAWGYLENVALQSNGKVGYGQYIGSNATTAMSVNDTQNYTVGAFLLAGCEAARYALGTE